MEVNGSRWIVLWKAIWKIFNVSVKIRITFSMKAFTTPMEASAAVRTTSMEVSAAVRILPWKLPFTFIGSAWNVVGVHGSSCLLKFVDVRGSNPRKFPLIPPQKLPLGTSTDVYTAIEAGTS